MRHIHDIMNPPDSYLQQAASKEWEQRRRAFLKTHGAWCRSCRRRDVPVQVHHINYTFGTPLWEYPDDELTVLCKSCHEEWTKTVRAFRRLFSFWNVEELKVLFGALKVAKEKYGGNWPATKLMEALERENFA